MDEWLSRRMVEKGVVKGEDQDIYRWGIRNGFIIILNLLTSLLIGLITDKLLAVMVFTLSFLVLRSYTGGFHSESRIFCYISSSLVLFIPVYSSGWFQKMHLIGILMFCISAVVIIFFFSPMDSRNRTLDYEEKKHFGKRARILSVLFTLVMFLLWHMRLYEVSYSVFTAIMLTAVFMVIRQIQKIIQNRMEE